ncbi:MAG TPA: vWA domain-containing protein [Pyrinomonadaceae bacterium]|nr:vWA domain-containing protein [Pyrinomonadaceae bacterium]
MKKLSVRILVATLTFIIGVVVANLWLTPRFEPVRVIHKVPLAQTARLEMVFVVDTTGSMSGLIDGAKQKIWGIVNDVMRESHSSVRIGLVAYRDRGDEYLTQVLPLTDDLDKVYTTLIDYRADGGGDGPEDVRTALAEAVFKLNWSPKAGDLAQVMFLVGDAPPHDDYDDAVDTLFTAREAVQKGIIVNAIQCGFMGETMRAWRDIARTGNGEYFSIASDGGVQAIASPYDEELNQLSRQLGATFVPYGFARGIAGDATRARVAASAAAIETRIDSEAPMVAKAERAMNKAVNMKAYIGDLLQNIENGTTKLDAIDPAQLPAELRELPAAERQQEIEKRLAERSEIRSRIMSLSKQRDAFIDAEKQKKTAGRDGFDETVSKALKRQLERK